jgi:hypothetical protein
MSSSQSKISLRSRDVEKNAKALFFCVTASNKATLHSFFAMLPKLQQPMLALIF